MTLFRALPLFIALATSPLAAAPPELRAEDAARLEAFDAALGRGLRAALAEGREADVAELVRAMAGAALTEVQPEGAWECRVMKLGRISTLVVYDWFSCVVEARADGTWWLEKRSGSQRTAGTLAWREGRIVYQGSSFFAGERPTPYAALPEVSDPTVSPQHLPEVGVLEQVSPDRMRLMLPMPLVESEFNILEFRR